MTLHDTPKSPSLSASSVSTPPSTPPEIDCSPDQFKRMQAGDGSNYSRWRPTYHLMPASGWMNDPCAPGYDPETGSYTVSFQWNPNGPDWGDICWGTAVSEDRCHWSVLEMPTLRRDTPYDGEGVFTGCLIPSIDEADTVMTVAYTSVSSLPIHHTLSHVRGLESLSLAQSLDSGKTWTKLQANPVLPCEPAGLDVTGWRDPFVARWPSMADILRLDGNKTMFGIISGGLRDLTPTTFVYAIDADDFTNWRYVGPLVDVGLNKRLSRWSGDLGRNWEVTNFMSLKDEYDPSITRDFLVMGTEGCQPAHDLVIASNSRPSGPTRPERGQLWMSGTLQQTDCFSNPVEMTYDFGGHLDHECLYAANSFFDPQAQKQVV